MSETRPGAEAGYDAGLLTALNAQGLAIDELLARQRGDEVYGVTTWDPTPGGSCEVVFSTARDGLLAVYHYGLKVYNGFPGWLPNAAHRGLNWTNRKGEIDPETIRLHRLRGGSSIGTPLPPVESVEPFISLDLAGARVFDPNTHRARLEDEKVIIVPHTRRARALRALGRATSLAD